MGIEVFRTFTLKDSKKTQNRYDMKYHLMLSKHSEFINSLSSEYSRIIQKEQVSMCELLRLGSSITLRIVQN